MRNDINPPPQHSVGIYRIRLAEYIATQPPRSVRGGCVISQIPWGFISLRRFGKRLILGATDCVPCTTPSTRRYWSLPISPLGGGYHHDCKSCISSVPLDCISSRLAVHITALCLWHDIIAIASRYRSIPYSLLYLSNKYST